MELDARVAVAERLLDVHGREITGIRMRLHTVEAQSHAVRLLIQQVEQLAATVEETANRAAKIAVDLAFAQRADLGRAESGHRLQWAAIVFTLLGFLLSVYVQTR